MLLKKKVNVVKSQKMTFEPYFVKISNMVEITT